MTEMSVFSKTIMEQKYSHVKEDGTKESWEEIAKRVAKNVLKSIDAPKEKIKEIEKLIIEKKFLPGGRYLYASGNTFHQTQNCLLLKAEDSREGWADLMQKSTMALMTGAGIGVDYSNIRAEGKPIRKTGGVSTGPLALMQMLNEAGRGIRQGGDRRSAIWAGLSWKHADVHKFIRMKDWSKEVRELKEKDFNFPATMDGTNISVLLDDDFFKAFANEKDKLHQQANSVYWAVVKQMLKTAEPGFSVDAGANSKETLRNACVSGDTEILTRSGYQRIDSLINTVTDIWNGQDWSTVTPKVTGTNQEMFLVTFSDGRSVNCTSYHNFVISKDYRGGTELVKAKDLTSGMKIAKYNFPVMEAGDNCEFAYAQGFISAEGMDDYNWLSLYEPKFVCENRLSKFAKKISGISLGRKMVTFNFTKFPKSMVPFNWNLKSKLDWLAGLFDGDGCELKEGGLQLVSVDFAFLDNLQKLLTTLGVNSKIIKANPAGYKMMPDGHGGSREYYCKETRRICIGSAQMQVLKKLGLKCERLSFDKIPNRDASQFTTVVDITENGIDKEVYCFNEPKNHTGCFNGIVTGQCTEVTSADDSDICNLGSINMAEIQSLEEMGKVVDLATYFLLAGTVYSDVPYAKVDQIRTKNRRLGLGLMGLHEWLLKNGKSYGPDAELQKYLEIYQTSTEISHKYADELGLSRPIKTRAIAPTGTIGILAETTTGVEPIFCVAYKRRYLKGSVWHYQYVIDPTAKRLIEKNGISPENIEDAYDLSKNVEKRLEFQAWVQQYVDHAISSTLNLPSWGSEENNEQTVQGFGNLLIKYLPKLRGMTCYPDGARGGQPLTPIKYNTAIKHIGEIFVEQADMCDITKGGSCGV